MGSSIFIEWELRIVISNRKTSWLIMTIRSKLLTLDCPALIPKVIYLFIQGKGSIRRVDLHAMPLHKWFRAKRLMILSLLIFGAAGLSCMPWFVAPFRSWNLKLPNFIRKLSLERTDPFQEFQKKSKILFKKFLWSIQAKESPFNKSNSINGGRWPITNPATVFARIKKLFPIKKS